MDTTGTKVISVNKASFLIGKSSVFTIMRRYVTSLILSDMQTFVREVSRVAIKDLHYLTL